LLKLTRRAQDAALPRVEIVDMRFAHPVSKEQETKRNALTPRLREAMELRLAKREGIVLLQNRRGFSTYIGCGNCGDAVMCPNCAVTLTYHTIGNRMQCHYCGYVSGKPTTCPTCGSDRLYTGGVGTQRVEEEIAAAFQGARIARMDLDTTARKGAFTKILDAFGKGEADILLGTQMVAKGLDFPRVTLVGVVNADTNLVLPDFRSSERTFQLLSQVSGRAGRKELAGEVLIQTMRPEHYAMRRVVDHDYEGFYRDELPMRQELNYPPFSRLVLVEFRGEKEADVHKGALAFATLLPRTSSYHEMLGPTTPEIRRLRNEFRWHVIIKNFKSEDASGQKMRRLLTGALEQFHNRFAKTTVKVTVDVDVQGLL
jgi:primosomal protein N' (replication factor Y)